MAVETALYPSQLNTALPASSDFVSEGDDHLRLLKTVVKTTFPNLGGAWNATQTEANYIVGVTSGIQGQLDSKAPKDSPVFTTAATLPAATTIGTVTTAELLTLSGVTSSIQTQINGKGAITGQAWTGSHSFTGGSITVPTLTPGSTGNGAASVDFVNSAAFASTLPGQNAATAGKFTTSNGSSASWAFPFLPEVPVLGTTVAAAVGSLYRLHNVAATTVTLPASPSDGDCIAVFAANRLTTNVIAGNGNNLCGLAEDMTIDNPYLPVQLKFRAGLGWDLIL